MMRPHTLVSLGLLVVVCLCLSLPVTSVSGLRACSTPCANGGYCYDGSCRCARGWVGPSCAQRASCPSAIRGAPACSGSDRGVCDVSTSKCVCLPGFAGETCAEFDKNCGGSFCSNHGSCNKGKCFCDVGFTGDKCDKQVSCGPKDNPCGGRGVCFENQCRCYPGFSGELCDVALPDTQSCPKNCSGKGLCSFGSCLCQAGWTGAACDEATAGSFCSTPAGKECNGHGVCFQDKCQCEPGSSGTFCEIGGCTKCHPTQGVCLRDQCYCKPGFGGADCSTVLTCPNECSRHGTCLKGVCACEPFYSGDSCEVADVKTLGKTGSQINCPSKCKGAGVCHQGKCLCMPGRSGPDCSIVHNLKCGSKPPTALPLPGSTTQSSVVPAGPSSTEAECNSNGSCFHGLCVCKPGFSGKFCQESRSCSAQCLVNGVCNYGSCLCAPGFHGKHCEINSKRQGQLHQLGSAKPLPAAQAAAAASEDGIIKTMATLNCKDGDRAKCSGHGTCKLGLCNCDEGFIGTTCEQVLLTGVYSSRCTRGCSGHGFCQLGKCVCDLGWSGAGCEQKLQPTCPANCNGAERGTCFWGKCLCRSSFTGKACEKTVQCSVDCSAAKNGLCVAGRCVCLNGYTGIDCSFPPAIVTKAVAPSTPVVAPVAAAAAPVNSTASPRFASKGLETAEEIEAHMHAELGASAAPVGVTGTYPLPLPPLVLAVASFVMGVFVAVGVKYAWDKREEASRKQKMLKPLLATR